MTASASTSDPDAEALLAERLEQLGHSLKARDKVIKTLMHTVKARQSSTTSSFDAFRTNAALQEVVTRKTGELQSANAQLAREMQERKEADAQRILLEKTLADAQRLEAIGRLAAGMAHEINTPTQYVGDNLRFLEQHLEPVIKLCRELVSLTAPTADQATEPRLPQPVLAAMAQADIEYLAAEIPAAIQQSLEGVGRIAAIVRAMKEFSHPGTQDKVLVDINHAIESTVTVGRSEWKYVAEVATDLDPELPQVPCFASEVNQVFLNMIVNAAHAIQDRLAKDPETKGVIRISTRAADGEVAIAIADNGCGIPPDNMKKIFEPFFTTKGVGRGTGQGLTMAYNVIVKNHGGKVDVESAVGVGTTFTVRLPIAPGPQHLAASRTGAS